MTRKDIFKMFSLTFPAYFVQGCSQDSMPPEAPRAGSWEQGLDVAADDGTSMLSVFMLGCVQAMLVYPERSSLTAEEKFSLGTVLLERHASWEKPHGHKIAEAAVGVFLDHCAAGLSLRRIGIALRDARVDLQMRCSAIKGSIGRFEISSTRPRFRPLGLVEFDSPLGDEITLDPAGTEGAPSGDALCVKGMAHDSPIVGMKQLRPSLSPPTKAYLANLFQLSELKI